MCECSYMCSTLPRQVSSLNLRSGQHPQGSPAFASGVLGLQVVPQLTGPSTSARPPNSNPHVLTAGRNPALSAIFSVKTVNFSVTLR